MGFQMQLLTGTANVQADEMAQMFQGEFTLDLQLEGQWPLAVSPGLLANFDHQFTTLGLGEDQFPTDGEEVIALREGVVSIALIRRQRAGLPNTGDLQMEMVALTTAWIGHPKVGLVHGQMAPHQGQHPTQYH